MHQSCPAPFCFWFVLSLAIGACWTTCCEAQTLQGNSIVSKPAKGVSKISGLSLRIRDDGLGNGQFGYRRLFFDVQSPTPVTADTQITVRASVSVGYRSQRATTIEVDGVLSAGQQMTTLVLRFPQTAEMHLLWWDVWIDAVPDKPLSQSREAPHPLGDSGDSRWRNNQLLILETEARPATTSTGQRVRNAQQSLTWSASLRTGELRENWLDFTPFDIVHSDIDILLTTAQDEPQRMAALRKWIHAGGILWVRQESDDWEALHDLAPLFDWQRGEGPIDPTKPVGLEPPGVGSWSYVNLRPIGPSEQQDGLVADFDPDAQPMAAPSAPTPIYTEDWFVVRRHGWGMVVAFQGDFAGDRRQWFPDKLQRANMYWHSQSWPQRHGLVPGNANTDFSNWLIPGVGLAPVVTFQVLITLFVLGIGPANYWLLKRAGKLHLMVLTVPVVALAITLALLSYGLLSDGFATRLRAQSITLLDQQTGDATSWSRLSYYSAFAPRNGLTFSDEAAVYAIHPGSIEAYDIRVAQSPREIQWTEDQQKLTSGWLASRTPTQYLVVQPRSTTAGLTLKQVDSSTNVANQFESAAQLIVVHDDQGAWWLAHDVPAGDTAAMESVEYSEAVAALRDILSDRQPRFPDAFAAAEDSELLYQQRRSMSRDYSRAGMDYAHVSASQNQLSQRWRELLGLAGGQALNLPPGSYVVVSDHALLAVSEDDFPEEESSVHIVIGKW